MANPNAPGSAQPVRPWDQQPAYLAAINRQLAPGQPAQYAVPRRQGRTPDDVTDFIAGQANWCKEHLPSILYVLNAPAGWKEFKKTKPQDLLDHNGHVVVEQDPPDGKLPRVMRNIPLLPMRIGSQEEEWYYEAVRRLDPRIRWEDITMRMKKKDRASDNCIQWRLSRGWREAMGMLSWHLTSNKGNTADEVANNRVKKRLGPWRESHNTTRGLTPGRKDPRASRDAPGNWISWPKSKGGKDWGKAQTTSFTDKIRKKPGPRKAKAVKSSGSGTQDADEQLEEDEQLEDEQSEDEASESSDNEYEQPTPNDSPYSLPGRIVADAHQQHGLGPRLTQHQMGQATQNGQFGVLRQGFNNHHLPQSQPSAPSAARPSNSLTRHFPSSGHQPRQATHLGSEISHNVPNRGAKRRIHELDMEDEASSQQQAKKPRVQQSQAHGAYPSVDEILAGMPNGTTMFLQHKAENPHLYTKEALAARKVQLGRADMNAAAFNEEMRKKYITGRSGYAQAAETSGNRNMASLVQPAEAKSRSPQESAGGQMVGNAGGVAPHSCRGNNGPPGSNNQNTPSTPLMSLTTSAAQPPKSRPYVPASTRAPPNGASIRPVPSVVGNKRNHESLDTDSESATSQQAKKARQSSCQDANVVNLSAEGHAAVLNFWNESQAKHPMTANPSSQQAPNSPQVNQRQYSASSSGLGSSQAARPVLRNAQGQNVVQSAGQIPPTKRASTESSLPQSMSSAPDPALYAIPASDSESTYGAPMTTTNQQAPYNSRIQNGSTDGYINPTPLNDPRQSIITQSAAADEIFNLDVFAPSSSEDSLGPDFPASSKMELQPGASDEGPMTAFLNADDLEFQLPEMGDL